MATLRSVQWIRVTSVPVTRCEPPEGKTCPLQRGSTALSGVEAKRHALEHPGHIVVREEVTSTVYELPPEV